MLRLKSAPRQSGSEAMINMMPMIDVVFLLLIFFLLTSVVVTQPVLDLSLPRATHSEPMKKGQVIQILIRREGQIEIDKKIIRLDALERFFKTKIQSGEHPKLLMTADQKAPFGIVVQILDLLQGLGLRDIAISTRTPEKNH